MKSILLAIIPTLVLITALMMVPAHQAAASRTATVTFVVG